MTSISLAQARPAPPFRPLLGTHPAVKTEPTLGDSATSDAVRLSEQQELAPPAKRRKIESPPKASSNPPTPQRSDSQLATTNGKEALRTLQKGPWRLSEAFMASLEEKEDDSEGDAKVPPLPSRPWQHRVAVKLAADDSKPTHRVRKNVPVPNTPDRIESPIDATRLGKSALAGFFPWTGKHPEDVLSESNVKQGYFDKPPNPPEKEQGSAKQPLYTAFRHRSGLETLSVLYGLTLERKAKYSTFASSSSFRPPPRVTLTEAKRRAWLADLANAEVPLRRLSRTIPQGIRGQALLDQCVSNSIPTARALWFIKCVGANEIRTLKRNKPGAAVTGGSEVRWLKEWTNFVQQFLESIFQQYAHSDWKKTIQYALRLTSHLYLENLLDRDLYLDWIVRNFAAANEDLLPFWLMLVHIYLADISRFRRRSRRLAGALVEKTNLARSTSETILTPLLQKLKSVIRTFVMSRPVCFLLPDNWPGCRTTLRYCLNLDVPVEKQLYDYVEKQNERLAASPREQSKDNTTTKQIMIKLLDNASFPFNVKQILEGCHDLCEDTEEMLVTVLEWSTTRYRGSEARIYLAVRLLRLWHRKGHDIETLLLQFVSNLQHYPSSDSRALRHLVAELSRSRTFSVSRYLQAMIVRGGPPTSPFLNSDVILEHRTPQGDGKVVVQTCDDLKQISTEVSLRQLPDHVVNLRKSVLARTGFQPEMEAAVIYHCKCYLAQKLPALCESPVPLDEANFFSIPNFTSLSWTVKCEISYWLREQVGTHCRPRDGSKVLGLSPNIDNTLTVDDFCFVRNVFEEMNDIAMLADILNLVSTTPRESLQASVVDTVDRHAEALSAIGAFNDLQQRLCQGYLTLRSAKPALPLLAVSLIDLSKRHPSKLISVKILQQDLVQGDRGSAEAAFSPFSDGIAESLQQAGSTFFYDFEAILQKETKMNEQTMTQLFAVLTERIEKQSQVAEDQSSTLVLCQLLARLRLYRVVQSKELLKQWVSKLLSLRDSNSSVELIVDLVGTGCVQFELVLECMKSAMKDVDKKKPISQEHATALLGTRDPINSSIQYRFETSRTRHLRQQPLEMLEVVSTIEPTQDAQSCLRKLLQSSVLELPSRVESLDGLSTMVKGCLQHEIDCLLQGTDKAEDTASRILSIIRVADDFSLSLCQLQLRLQMATAETLPTEEVGDAFFAVASNALAIEASDTSRNSVWASLLPAAGPNIARHVRQRAEEAFLVSLPGFLQSRSINFVSEASSNKLAETIKYLDIAFVASESVTDQITSPTMTMHLIEKFSVMLRMLGGAASGSAISPLATSVATPGQVSTPTAPTPTANATATATSVPLSSESLTVLTQYLPLLLRMTCLQRPPNGIATSPAPALPSKVAQQEQIKLVVLLVSIALHPALSTTNLPSHILSVSSSLITAPNFTDEMQTYCAKLLKDRMRDVRIQFLFGSVNLCGSAKVRDTGEGLQLYKEGVGRVSEWKQWVRPWEVIEPSGGGDGSGWVGIGMFGATRV